MEDIHLRFEGIYTQSDIDTERPTHEATNKRSDIHIHMENIHMRRTAGTYTRRGHTEKVGSRLWGRSCSILF